MGKKLSDGPVPEYVRGFIHQEGMEGGAGHYCKTGAVIFYVQHEGFDLLRLYGSITFFQDGGYILRNQMEHEPER